MRKNFADILKSAKINIKKEYEQLYELLYDKDFDSDYGEKTSLYDEFSEYFINVWFRGTSLSLEDFDEQYGFDFEKYPQSFNIDYLINFCEYFYNLICRVSSSHKRLLVAFATMPRSILATILFIARSLSFCSFI